MQVRLLLFFTLSLRSSVSDITTYHARQIPYAIGQFTVNELCHELVNRSMTEEQRKSLSPTSNFGITLSCGIIAGFAAAILSHVSHFSSLNSSRRSRVDDGLQPADTLLSQINKGHGPTGSMPHRLKVLAQQAGFRGLFAGLGPRMIMTAGLVAGQFILYQGIKDGGLCWEPLSIYKVADIMS